MSSTLMNAYNKETIDNLIINKLGLSKDAISKFNTCVIDKTEDGVHYIEYWLLVNASYDYTNQRFVKVDLTAASFGIQLQAKGTYPGEHELGYDDIQGINFWRNPIRDNDHTFYDTSLYDYTDTAAHNYIGAKYDNSSWGDKNGTWREFGLSAGWNNNFMTDSNGGITVGGAGFEVDGNGIFPFIRLSSSRYYDGTNAYFLTGIIENAYHPSAYKVGNTWYGDWDCDSNQFGAYFFGLRIPVNSAGGKDTANAKFVVMYNNMAHASSSAINDMSMQDWNLLLEVSNTSIKAMVSGTLTTLGAGGGSSGTVDTSMSSTSTNAVQNKVIKAYVDGLVGNIQEDMLL